MWIKRRDGVVFKVLHEAHIARLLSEGGQEVPDPRETEADKRIIRLDQREYEQRLDGPVAFKPPEEPKHIHSAADVVSIDAYKGKKAKK